jgi:diguanylate cyclase (GGDEF)-like protein
MYVEVRDTMGDKNIFDECDIDDIERLKFFTGDVNSLLDNIICNLMVGVGVFKVASLKDISARYLSDNYFKVVGYSKKEYENRKDKPTSFLVDADEKKLLEKIDEAIKGDGRFKCICRRYKSDENMVYFNINGVLIGYEEGEPLFLTTISDITSDIYENERLNELRIAEEKLEIEKQRYRILEETTHALLFEYIIDEDTMILNYNFPDNHERKIIKEYTEFSYRNPLVHKRHIDKFLNALKHACEVPTEGTLEYLSEVSGKGYQWHRAIYSSVETKGEKIISVVGRIYNIHNEVMEREKQAGFAMIDGLTGAYIRKAGYDKMNKEYKSNINAKRYLILLDVDNFKEVNDTRGHSTGDIVLKKLSQEAIELFGESGFVTRYGGDEFLVFVQNLEYDKVEEKLADLHRYIKKLSDSLEVDLDFSEGIVKWQEMTLSQAFEIVDARMYENKRAKK